MKKILSSLICIFTFISISTTTSIQIKANDTNDQIFVEEEIYEIASTFNVDESYVEKYNSEKLVEEKLAKLNLMEPNISKTDLGNEILIETEKTIYLDEKEKLPMTITSSYTIPKNNIAIQTQDTHLYQSSYQLLFNTWTQNIRYIYEMPHLTSYRAQVIDTYGTFEGGGSCSESSSFSQGMSNHPWARTVFSFSAQGVIQKDFTAYSTYSNYYGIWTTTW